MFTIKTMQIFNMPIFSHFWSFKPTYNTELLTTEINAFNNNQYCYLTRNIFINYSNTSLDRFGYYKVIMHIDKHEFINKFIDEFNTKLMVASNNKEIIEFFQIKDNFINGQITFKLWSQVMNKCSLQYRYIIYAYFYRSYYVSGDSNKSNKVKLIVGTYGDIKNKCIYLLINNGQLEYYTPPIVYSGGVGCINSDTILD